MIARLWFRLFPPNKSVLALRDLAVLTKDATRPVPKYPAKVEKLQLRLERRQAEGRGK